MGRGSKTKGEEKAMGGSTGRKSQGESRVLGAEDEGEEDVGGA